MNDIQIDVLAYYVDAQSEPDEERYVFAYHITINNRSAVPCQLISRHWIITDATGAVEEVKGEGVVGKQPRLEAGETFQYTSGAILKTPVGAMQGAYHFVDDGGSTFEVPIAPFSLSMPNLVH